MINNIDEAISILSEELHHTEFHLQDEGKAPEYYEEMKRYCDALRLAIDALKYRTEVDKYGSELAMAYAERKHDEEYLKGLEERKKDGAE